MTISETAGMQPHSFRWRLLTKLAVAFALTTGFAFGRILTADIAPDVVTLTRAWLQLFGIQAGCILLWLCLCVIRSRVELPRGKLYRPWWRLRSRIRKRWIGNRSKQDYRNVEASVVVPVSVFGGVLLLALVPLQATNYLLILGVIAVWLVGFGIVYHGASDKPTRTAFVAAGVGVALGYQMDSF
jgi:hypothetical protein